MITGSFDPISNAAAQADPRQQYIWVVNASSYDDEAGESWYFANKTSALQKFNELRDEIKDDDTFHEDETSCGVDSYYVYFRKKRLQ